MFAHGAIPPVEFVSSSKRRLRWGILPLNPQSHQGSPSPFSCVSCSLRRRHQLGIVIVVAVIIVNPAAALILVIGIDGEDVESEAFAIAIGDRAAPEAARLAVRIGLN